MSKKMPQPGARVRLKTGEKCVVTKVGVDMLGVRGHEGDSLLTETVVLVPTGWEHSGGEVLPRPLPAIGQPVKNVTTQMTGVVRGVIEDRPTANGEKGGIKVEWDTATKGVTYGWINREQWDWAYLVEYEAEKSLAERATETMNKVSAETRRSVLGDHHSYMVGIKETDKPAKFMDYDNAQSKARELIKTNKSGTAVLYKAIEVFQREEPPVKHTVLGDDQ